MNPETASGLVVIARQLGEYARPFKPYLEDLTESVRLGTTARWRFRNALAAMQWAQQELARRGIPPDRLPSQLRDILPILEGASDDDDPTLHALWSRLLTNALDPHTDVSSVQYAAVLRQLSPSQAKILQYLAAEIAPSAEQGAELPQLALRTPWGPEDTAFLAAFQHLENLGLVAGNFDVEPHEAEHIASRISEGVFLSVLGQSLMSACAAPGAPANGS